MKYYLIIHKNGMQTVALLQSPNDLLLKYPETFLAIIELEKDVINNIMDGKFLSAADYM